MALTANDSPLGRGWEEKAEQRTDILGRHCPPLQPYSVLTALGTGQHSKVPPASLLLGSTASQVIKQLAFISHNMQLLRGWLGCLSSSTELLPGPPVTTVSPQPVLQEPPYWSGCSDWKQGLAAMLVHGTLGKSWDSLNPCSLCVIQS